MTGWKEIPFRKLLIDEVISYGIVQPGQHQEQNSVPIIRVNNFHKRRLNTSEVLKVSKDIEKNYSRTRLEGGELLITVVGSIGQCAIAPASLRGWNVARAVAVARINDEFDKYFIMSQFESEDIQFQMYGNTNDTVQPTLNLSSLKELKFRIPSSKHEQKAIAAVLSSLDDKIDLLHRQNATLEAMAEALFRQWFVVEAKEEWEEKRLGEFFPIKTGKKDANYSVENGEYPFFTCSKQTLHAPDYSFEGSAILLAGNGDFNVKRYSGKFEAYQRTYVLIPYSEAYFNFLYVVIQFFLNEITEGHRGSVINFITKGMIEDFVIAMPPDDIMPKLNHFNNIYASVDANMHQIRSLEKLRDTLLPKLMSGEVRIRDAEKFVEVTT